MTSRVAHGWARAGLAALGCSVLIWLSVGITAEMMPFDSQPSALDRLWPWGADIRTAQAGALIRVDATQGQLDRAAALASAALARAPASAAAARTLGEVYAVRGDLARADPAYTLAERLSRRDLLTEMFWVQREVARGDVNGALVHYDRALRTNESAWPLLLDKLTGASAEAPVATGVVRLLDRTPPWRFAYVRQLTDRPVPPALFAMLVTHARLDPSDPLQRAELVAALRRLADEGQPRLAYGLLPVAFRSPAVPVDGDFEETTDARMEPFAWHLRSDSDLSATRTASTSGHGATVLRLLADAGRGGEVASQMLVLVPGRYRLSAVAGDVAAGTGRAPTASVTCLGATEPLLALPLAPRARSGPVTGAFSVPAGCAGQNLVLSTPPAASTDAWVDDIVIRREPA